MLNRFHLIPERHGRTDRQTDRSAISISRVSVLICDKYGKKCYMDSEMVMGDEETSCTGAT